MGNAKQADWIREVAYARIVVLAVCGVVVLLLATEWVSPIHTLLWVGLVVLAISLLMGWLTLLGWRMVRDTRTHARVESLAALPLAPAETPLALPLPVAKAGATAPAPTKLGRYEVVREIGRGAMGVVLLGVDPASGRPVALKTVEFGQTFEGDALAEARQRFFREARTAARLRHSDIVTIYDVGENKDLAYIAMEYLTGSDLRQYTQPGRLLPVASVLSIVARVAEALAYAHRQGVVHRDIKPANVMVDLASDSVKVTDFGIAQVDSSSRTRTGTMLGTPAYMSPEQLAGRRVDGRSDLYSLAVMLFQLLCGRLPHEAESMASLMYQIANQPAPNICRLRPELPETLGRLVALALEKRSETRYSDSHRLAQDLLAVAAAVQPDLGGMIVEALPEILVPRPGSGSVTATSEDEGIDPRHNHAE